MEFQPGAILAAFDTDGGEEEVAKLFEMQAKPLVAKGVDVLIPGGGIPMLLFSRLFNHNVEGAPVMNGIPVLVKMTEMAVKLRRLTGLNVSRTSDFALPPQEIIGPIYIKSKESVRNGETTRIRRRRSMCAGNGALHPLFH